MYLDVIRMIFKVIYKAILLIRISILEVIKFRPMSGILFPVVGRVSSLSRSSFSGVWETFLKY